MNGSFVNAFYKTFVIVNDLLHTLTLVSHMRKMIFSEKYVFAENHTTQAIVSVLSLKGPSTKYWS